MPERSGASPADYFAAERTFLAWIRTGLALMGFGFVVARFGLFLQAMRGAQPAYSTQQLGLSFWFGTGLILLGVFVNALSAWSHIRLVHRLERGAPDLYRPSALAVAVAVILSALGLAMAIYLISVRDPIPAHSRESDKRSEAKPMTSDSGITTILSRHSVDETVKRVENALTAKGVKLFTLIDHSGEAEKAGLQMRPTKLLIFGNPKAGTHWMVAAPSIALDLPLKILVAEDADGKAWISYNDPAYLQSRHHLPPELFEALKNSGVDALAAKVAE